jgi:hypothetical protein
MKEKKAYVNVIVDVIDDTSEDVFFASAYISDNDGDWIWGDLT